MRSAATALAMALAFAAPAAAAMLPARTFERPCAIGAARLRLTLGALPRGVEIVVYTQNGKLIGTAAPFALRAGQRAGIHQLPLPEALFRDGRVTLRLSAKQYGRPERAPTVDEVEDAAVLCVPAPG